MFDEVEIEEEMRNSFNRILRRIPKKLQEDEYILNTVVAYLKIGGEKLARQSVKAFKVSHKLETVRRKRKLRDKALLRTAGALRIKREIAAVKNEKDVKPRNIV